MVVLTILFLIPYSKWMSLSTPARTSKVWERLNCLLARAAERQAFRVNPMCSHTQYNICFEYGHGCSSSSKLVLLVDGVVAASSIFPPTASVDEAAAMVTFAVYSETNMSCSRVL